MIAGLMIAAAIIPVAYDNLSVLRHIGLFERVLGLFRYQTQFTSPLGGNRSGPSQAVNPQRRTASDLTEITPDFYSSKVRQLP